MDRKYKRHFRRALLAACLRCRPPTAAYHATQGGHTRLRHAAQDRGGYRCRRFQVRAPWNDWWRQAGEGGWHIGWHRLSTHVSERTPPRGVGLVERSYLLVPTGRGHGRWDGGELEMPEDTRNDRLLRDDGNDVQRAPAAKGTDAHLQPKNAAQQPSPRPVRGARWRLLPVQPLLAQCRTDRPTQMAVGRQAAPIAHQMDAR